MVIEIYDDLVAISGNLHLKSILGHVILRILVTSYFSFRDVIFQSVEKSLLKPVIVDFYLAQDSNFLWE